MEKKSKDLLLQIYHIKWRYCIHDGFIGGITVDIMSKIVDKYSIEPHIHPFVEMNDFNEYEQYFIEECCAKTFRHSIFDPQIFFGTNIESLKFEFSRYMKNHYYLDLFECEILQCFHNVFL
jgi:hypothetical protein